MISEPNTAARLADNIEDVENGSLALARQAMVDAHRGRHERAALAVDLMITLDEYADELRVTALDDS